MYWSRARAWGQRSPNLGQEIEHVLDVGAFLVEIGRIIPSGATAALLSLGGHPLDGHHPVDVPSQIVAVELDFEVGEAVGGDPFGQRFRQAVVDPRLNVGLGERIEGADQVVQRHRRLRPPQGIAIEILAGEFGGQVVPTGRRRRIQAPASCTNCAPSVFPYASWMAASKGLAATSWANRGIVSANPADAVAASAVD